MKKPKKLIWVHLFNKPTIQEVNDLLNEYGRKTMYMFIDEQRGYAFRPSPYPGMGETFKKVVKLIQPNVTYHRKPTPGEIKRGYGATHYRDFKFTDCIKPDGNLKKRLKADDGLIYTR